MQVFDPGLLTDSKPTLIPNVRGGTGAHFEGGLRHALREHSRASKGSFGSVGANQDLEALAELVLCQPAIAILVQCLSPSSPDYPSARRYYPQLRSSTPHAMLIDFIPFPQ